MITPNKTPVTLTVAETPTTLGFLNIVPGRFSSRNQRVSNSRIASMESAIMKNRGASSPWTTTEKTLPRSVKSPLYSKTVTCHLKRRETASNAPLTNVRAIIHRFATSTYNFTMYAQREEVILCLDYIRWHIRLFSPPTGCSKSVRMRLLSCSQWPSAETVWHRYTVQVLHFVL